MSKKQPLPPEAIAAWLDKFPPEKRMFKGKTYLVLKQIMDLSIIFLSAPFWIPVLALVALAIKIDSPGAPVLFIQERTGKGGRRIKMYKFRTMVPNAEELKIKYADRNELQWPDFKITNDPRITRVGKFLRKTSLDETPQLFNIIKGEMSLVGPRPTSFSAKTYRLWQTERLDVTPGLTGLWQIFGRAAYEFDDRLRLDIAYIDRRSIWMDINILFETVWAVFSQRGAH